MLPMLPILQNAPTPQPLPSKALGAFMCNGSILAGGALCVRAHMKRSYNNAPIKGECSQSLMAQGVQIGSIWEDGSIRENLGAFVS